MLNLSRFFFLLVRASVWCFIPVHFKCSVCVRRDAKYNMAQSDFSSFSLYVRCVWERLRRERGGTRARIIMTLALMLSRNAIILDKNEKKYIQKDCVKRLLRWEKKYVKECPHRSEQTINAYINSITSINLRWFIIFAISITAHYIFSDMADHST